MKRDKNKQTKDIDFARIGSWARSIGYFLTLGTFGLVVSSFGPVLPDLAAQVSVSLNVISIIFTARALGFLFGALLGGKVYDNHEGHIFFSVAFLSLSLLIAFIPLNKSFYVLVGMVFGQGIALGLVVTGASTFIVWEHADNPGPWLNTQSFVNGVGGFLSPLIVSFSYSKFGMYSQSFWVYAMIAGILSAYFFFLNSPKIREEERKVRNERKHPTRLIYLIALIFLLYVGAEVSLNGWIFTVATTAYRFTDSNARLLNSLFWGAMAVGRLIGISVSKHLPPDKMLTFSFIGSIISIFIAILFPNSSTSLWIAVVSSGLFMALIFPSLMIYVETQVSLSGKKTGIFFSATSIGGMLLPWISGQVFTLFNPRAVNFVIFFTLSFGFFMFLYVQSRLEDTQKEAS
ncbi:MAG: MFS transporter [Anaerolineaceae bacterium]|nr:MFS transporter [Anaerolineaceae bacterium]